jgi:hypothetical protein
VCDAYWVWVRRQAALVESDGCTRVPDWCVDYCYEHDLAYRTHKDPRDAWRVGWANAKPIKKRVADRRLGMRYLRRGNLVLALTRWLGPTIGGDFDARPEHWLERLQG